MGEADVTSDDSTAGEKEESTKGDDQSSDGADAEDQDDSDITDETEIDDPGEADISAEDQISDDKQNDEEAAGGNKVHTVTPNAIVPSDLTVTVVEPDTSENAAPGATVALTSADIVYTNGCVSGDGKLRKNADITFKLLPKAGKKLGQVQYKTKATTDGATESGLTGATLAGDTYTIPRSALMHDETVDGKTESVNYVNVTIVVSTTDIEYTLKAGTNTGYKLYLTKVDGEKTVYNGDKEIAAVGLDDRIKYAKRADEVSFAVVADTGTDTIIRSVKVQADGGEEKVLESKANTGDAALAPIYTFKPSELAGIAENDNQDITITVDAKAAATINIAKNLGAGATLKAVTDDADVYGGAAVQAANVSSANEGDKVIFAVEMDKAYKALAAGDVTATLGTDPITVTPVAEKAATTDATKKTEAHYMIDLAEVTEDATLTIKVNTELSDDANKVTFESVSENSIIKKSSDVLNGKTVKVKDDPYTFDVEAKPGYKIYAISAAYTKKYEAQTDKTTPADKAVTDPLATDKLKVENGAALGEAALSGVQVPFSGEEAIDGVTWAWTTALVTVKVNAKMDAFEDDKTVTINSAYDYDVKTGDKIVAGDVDDAYTVEAGAELFEFTVDAVTEPFVTAKNDGKDILLDEATQTEAGWVYQIAAGALDDAQVITIERQTFNIAVDYDHDNIIAEVYDPSDLDEAMTAAFEIGTTDTYSGQEADYAYKFIIAAENDDTKIAKVSYTVGDSEEATEVKARGGSYVFSVDLTDDVDVTVETKEEFDLVVRENGAIVTPDKKNVYNVAHASTVTAALLKGDGVTNEPLFNAEVKDGNAVAATIARIDEDNVVTLELDSSEYNKELTVELTLNDKKTKKAFKVKTTAAANEVTITGVKNGKVDLPVDTKASYKLTVKTKNATLDGIAVNVVPVDDTKKADATAITAARNAVDAAIVDGNLVITAKPAMTGAENAAKVIIVDGSGLTADGVKALTVDNALKNGVVTVNTKDATIVGKKPTVSLVSTTDQTIKVKLGVPKGVVDPEVGKIFYKVELTVPTNPEFPTGTSDAAKQAITAALTAAQTDWNTNHLYQEKAVIDANGGLLEIPVMKFTDANVTAGLDKGVLMSGFSVKATLLQTTAADSLPSVDATTIKGDEAALENIATKNPYYEVKLSLKKGTTTLITGQHKDVTVATPNFNKLTSYSTVKVEFVDTSTGAILGSYISDGEYAYYGGMYAEYNELSNAVTVNAFGSSYDENVNGTYKNLGVKVTAYAQDSAYGAVATQKLTVVNGIEEINPSAPLEIYKADNKAASFNVTIDLNGSNSDKKNAPKSKKVDYKIVAADYDPEYAEEGDDPTVGLPANIKTNVTVKNGKVTIAKGYIPAPKAADNKFKVMVSAADYAGNPVKECTNVITITSEGLQMGDIAVFDSSDGIKGAGTASIEATKRSNEYQVHVLKPGVKTTKKSYTETDYVDYNLLTFKSSNAKSVAVDPDGTLTILKAAKNVKITAIPKDGSNPKPVKTLTLTVGQVASAAPLLKITRYEDSTFDAETVLNEKGEKELTYYGNNTNNYFKLEVVKEVKDEEGKVTGYDKLYLANYNISYKGAKKLSQSNGDRGDEITIVANAKDTTITLKDKAVKNSTPVVYKLTNNNFVDTKGVTTPKIATTRKLTQNTWADNVYYTVKGGKKDDFTGKYVMLSIDQTKKNPGDIESVFAYYETSYLDKPLPILLGAGFNLYVDTDDCQAGNYNLVATVGSLENGVFKPEYKDAKVVVKIAKAKAASLSATGNYTLSMKNQNGAVIKYKSGNGWVEYTNSAIGGNYAKNAIINGQENDFAKYFIASYDDFDRMTIALKNLPLTAPQNDPDAPALDKITGNDATAKNNRIGYISINNGYKYIDVKLTITLKDCTADKTKYKVTASPVLSGPKAVTALTVLDGKSRVDIEYISAVSEAVGGVGLFKPVGDYNGNLYLEATRAIEKGTYPVDLYIIPSNAPQAYKDAVANATGDAKQAAYEKYGVKASIKVTAADKAVTKNKVVLAKGGNTWNVADTDYNADSTNWSRYTSLSFKNKLSIAETTNIAVKAAVNNADIDYVTFDVYSQAGSSKYMTYETIEGVTYIVLPASYGMNITLDKAKLTKAITDNKALEANKQNKSLDWGKTLKVKATFSYGENGPVADDVTVSIKLPANAGADDAAVKAALEDEAFNKKLQSDIETYTKRCTDDYYNWYAGADENLINGWINDDVESYIRNEIIKKIKGASVTVTITNNAAGTSAQLDEDEEENPTPTTVEIASEWTVTVTSTTEKEEGKDTFKELYKKVFEIPTAQTMEGVVAEIKRLSLGSDVVITDGEGKPILKVTAATTAEEFAKAVREKLGASATRNISITAEITDKKDPSVEEGGNIDFELTIKDLSKSPSEGGYSGNTDVSFTLGKLDDLDTCKNNVITGLNAGALTTIVTDAWVATHTTDEALNAKVKELVVAKANELIDNNPAITVTGIAKNEGADIFNLTKPTGESNKGKLSFTLQLTETGKTADELADASYQAAIRETELDAIAEFQNPTEILAAAMTISEIEYVDTEAKAFDAIKALIVAKIKNPAYSESSITVGRTPDEGDTKGTEFTIPEGTTDGKITKVKVMIGEQSETIPSVTVKVQPVTPAPTE